MCNPNKKDIMTPEFYIPKKLLVGFRKSEYNTETGQLGFVTFLDPKKGNIKCETSWNKWRDKTIEPQEITNEPISGFILENNEIRYSYSGVIEKCRVTDPRGFTFEISISNLFNILKYEGIEATTKNLTGKYCYAWSDFESKTLVLVPETDKNYESWFATSRAKEKPLGKTDLIPGHYYKCKYNYKDLLFVGNLKVVKSLTTGGYNTQALFLPPVSEFNKLDRIALVNYPISSILYDTGKEDLELASETKELFEKTAFSFEFWKNKGDVVKEFINLEKEPDFKNRITEENTINYNSDVMPMNPINNLRFSVEDSKKGIYRKLGDMLEENKVILLKPICVCDKENICVSTSYRNWGLTKISPLIEIEKFGDTLKVTDIDKLGPRKDYGMGHINDLTVGYPQSKIKSYIPYEYKGESIIPGYLTHDNYKSDSLHIIGSCEAAECVWKLNNYYLPWQ